MTADEPDGAMVAGTAESVAAPAAAAEETTRSVQLNERTVNTHTAEIIRPESFQLLKVLGKGGYGKVCAVPR